MDHLRIMGFLVLSFTALFALQFAEARVLEHHFHNAALSQHNSAVAFDSDLDAMAVASSRPNYTSGGGDMRDYSESNRGSNSGNSTHVANNTVITVELLPKEATPENGSSSKTPAGIEEVEPIEGNADTLHETLNSHSSHMSVNDGIEGNILSSLGKSPGVGHWEKSKTKSKYSTFQASKVLSGPSPGVVNAHTSAVSGTQSESGTFNKLPSGSSPGVGHKVTSGYTEMAQAVSITQESESKKKMTMMNILPSGPSPGVGNSATNGRNMMEKGGKDEEGMGIQTFLASNVLSGPSPGVGNGQTSAIGGTQSESGTFNKLPSGSKPGVGHEITDGYTAMTQESKSKKSAILNILPSGPSPGVGNSATNGRNAMENNITEKDAEGMAIQTFNRLPSGSSPGVGHSYTNAHALDKIEGASEDRKGSDHIPIFHKLGRGPSPGGGHSSTARMELSSVIKTSSNPSPGDDNSSTKKLNPAHGSPKKKAEETAGALDRKIRCDVGGLDFYGTPTPPMFGISAAAS